jgi:hypothetical protein
MSTNLRYPVEGERAVQLIAGSFRVSAGAIVDVLGEGFTVSYDAVGKYTVTFDKGFPEALSAQATLETALTAGIDQMVQVYSRVTGSCKLRLWDISAVALADPGSAADDRIHFLVVTKSSGL